MKTKIILLLFVSVITMSFNTPVTVETSTNPVTPEVICITISDISDLEKLNLEDEIGNPFTLEIAWTGDAAWQASMNFQQIRNTVRASYENNYGKSTQETILSNNSELWSFDGSRPKTEVEATVQSDPNVDCTDCD